MGIIAVVDRAALAGYCVAWSELQAVNKVLREEGRTFETTNGYVVARPEVSMQAKYLQLIRTFCALFGMSPSDRSGMNVPERPDEDESRMIDSPADYRR